LQHAAATVQPVSATPPAATQVRSRLTAERDTDAK
jgi:hypothetical protein